MPDLNGAATSRVADQAAGKAALPVTASRADSRAAAVLVLVVVPDVMAAVVIAVRSIAATSRDFAATHLLCAAKHLPRCRNSM